MTSSLQIVGYISCSSTEQATDGVSLDAQRARIAAWCDATGARLVELVEDAGVSGTRALAARPGGARIAALLDARRPAIDAVAIMRLDRLGRDAAETLLYLRRFARGSVGLVSIVDQVDLTTPQGRAMAQLGAVFAELERALIGQRTAEALQTLRGDGRVYGPAPYGFEPSGGRFVELADEREQLDRIYRMRERGGESFARIAENLNRDGVPAKRGGTWYAMSVRSVLRTAASFEREAA